jgi:hypothetical protein
VSGEQLTGTAKWQDILKLYAFDRSLVYCQLPKATDRHVRPSIQSEEGELVRPSYEQQCGTAFNAVFTTTEL